ncbi:MAG TPA: hypothetical protein VFU15_07895 [Bacteroidia bacterium]|nr:hypothetical protein [Bacteroidia bacterium]
MKRIASVIFFTAALLFAFSCKYQPRKITGPGTMIVLKGPDGSDVAQLKNFIPVLTKRLISCGIGQDHFFINDTNGEIDVRFDNTVKLSDTDERYRIMKLFTTSGQLRFHETYTLSELWKNLLNADSIVRSWHANGNRQYPDMPYSLVDLLHPPAPGAYSGTSYDPEHSPVIGFCTVNDTSAVSFVLGMKEVRGQFPENVRFHWTYSHLPENQRLFGLVAIRLKDGDENYFDPGPMKDVVIDENRNGGNRVLNMTFDDVAAASWANMTRSNIGRCVTIEIDNRVLMYPVVQAEIPGGASSISGNFTNAELDFFRGILRSGGLPWPLHVTEEKMVQ